MEQLINFLKETFQRFFTKSPKFFQIWQIISAALVLITGVPPLLATLGITLPELWNHHVNLAVGWASRAALFMSLMTNQSTLEVKKGEIIKQTDAEKLPFTATNEVKTVLKEIQKEQDGTE